MATTAEDVSIVDVAHRWIEDHTPEGHQLEYWSHSETYALVVALTQKLKEAERGKEVR